MMKSTFGIGRNNEDARLCVEEAVRDFKNPKIIIFFSGENHFCEYTKLIHNRFPDCVCIGCSAYRTWSAAGTEKDVLNALAIEDGITCSAGVIDVADQTALAYSDNVRKCLDEISATENTICVEFTVPYKKAEEYAIMALNSVLLKKNISVIGGTAANICADTDISDKAYVSLNGEIYSEGCVFALIHNTGGKISLYRENIYEPLTGKEYTATKANSITRTIMTFDNTPASKIYAKELNVPIKNIRKYFFHYPMGQCVGNETYVTAIQSEGTYGSLRCLARVHEGTKMMVMKEGNYREITRKTINDVKNEVKNPSLVLMFHCVARTVLFETNGYIDEYEDMMADAFPNFIGFACLGEQQGTKNFNHTMMLAVFE